MSTITSITSPLYLRFQLDSVNYVKSGSALACLTVLGYALYCKFLHPLAKYPGPFWAAFGPLWATYISFRGDWIEVMTEMHARYGKVVRIGRNEVDIDDIAAVDAIYAVGKGFPKSEFYMGFGNPRQAPNIFSTMDDKYHAQLRRFMGSAFTMKSLQSMEVQINTGVARLLKVVKTHGDKNSEIDLGWILKCLAFDLSCFISNGYSVGALEGKDSTGCLDAMTFQQKFAGNFGRIYNIRRMIQKTKPPEQILKAFMFLEQFLQAQVAQHEAEAHDEPTDMMGLIMQSQKGKSRAPYPDLAPDNVLYAEVSQTVIAAGADTTATTLIAMLYHLLHNPHTLASLQKEVDSVASEARSDGTFDCKTVNDMPYLNATIKEALRVHPAVGFPLPRYVPESGLQLGKDFFVPGTVVGVNAWHLHQHEEIFGNDCKAFRPERWLEADQKTLAQMDKYLFSFGYGSRTCLGKNISLVEMRLAIPALLNRFELSLPHNAEPLTYKTQWFALLEHLQVVVKTRRKPAN